MKNVHVPGAVPNVGGAQGYIGISVLYGEQRITLNGESRDVNCYSMFYKPDRDELRRLNEGASIRLTLLGGPPVIPHSLDVTEV